MTQHIIILIAKFITVTSAKGKDALEKSLQETRHKLPRVLAQWSHAGCPNSSLNKLCDSAWDWPTSVLLPCPSLIGSGESRHTAETYYKRKAKSKIM